MLALDRTSFKRLLGPLEDILRRNTKRYTSLRGVLCLDAASYALLFGAHGSGIPFSLGQILWLQLLNRRFWFAGRISGSKFDAENENMP